MSEHIAGARRLGPWRSAGLGLSLALALGSVSGGPLAAMDPRLIVLWGLAQAALWIFFAGQQWNAAPVPQAHRSWMHGVVLALQGSARWLLLMLALALLLSEPSLRWIGPAAPRWVVAGIVLSVVGVGALAALGLAGVAEATLGVSAICALATAAVAGLIWLRADVVVLSLGQVGAGALLATVIAVVLPVLTPVMRPPRRLPLGAALLACLAGAVLISVGQALTALPSTPGSWVLLLLVLVSPLWFLASLHLLLASYEVMASLDRAALVPRALLQRPQRLGTPVLLLAVEVALICVLAAAVPRTLVPPLLVALALLSSVFHALRALFLAASQRRGLALGIALLALLPALALVLMWAQRHPRVVQGAALASLGLALAMLLIRRAARRLPPLRASTAEMRAASSASGPPILTLGEAQELAASYPARVLVAALDTRPSLVERVLRRAEDDQAAYVLFVDEVGGLFYPPQIKPSAQALEVLVAFCGELDRGGLQGLPIWRVAHDPAASIAQAARALSVERVIVAVPEARPLAEVLRGQTLSRLRKLLGGIALEVVRPQTGGDS